MLIFLFWFTFSLCLWASIGIYLWARWSDDNSPNWKAWMFLWPIGFLAEGILGKMTNNYLKKKLDKLDDFMEDFKKSVRGE